MFLKDKGGSLSPQDAVFMQVIADMQKKQQQESYREKRRGQTQYPASSDGTKNGVGSSMPAYFMKSKPKLSKFSRAGMDSGASTRGMFNPTATLDTSQVEDRRSFETKMQEFLKGRGAFTGDPNAERPAPMGGGSGEVPMEVMLSILKQRLNGQKQNIPTGMRGY
jgi:hypothetical protein